MSIRSRQVRDQIKLDRASGSPPRYGIDFAVDRLKHDSGAAALHDLLGSDAVLIPCPGSSPRLPIAGPASWIPYRICRALVAAGLGRVALECLTRQEAVPKSAFAARGHRPSPQRHFDTIEASNVELANPSRIVVVDDFITKGATMLAAASHVAALFPTAAISGFALVRTMGLIPEIDRIVDPVVGTIRLTASGDTDRQP